VTRYNRPRDPVLDAADPWANLSAPCASGDSLYVAPNAGLRHRAGSLRRALALIRPSTRRWSPKAPPPRRAKPPRPRPAATRGRAGLILAGLIHGSARSKPRGGAMREGPLALDAKPQRVSDALLVAPLDNDRVVALDARSGNKLCTRIPGDLHPHRFQHLRPGDLPGARLTALDKEGELKWTWDGQSTGPAMVADEMVFIPTRRRDRDALASDGKVIPKPSVTPPTCASCSRTTPSARHWRQQGRWIGLRQGRERGPMAMIRSRRGRGRRKLRPPAR
jgi:hypothetical protein